AVAVAIVPSDGEARRSGERRMPARDLPHGNISFVPTLRDASGDRNTSSPKRRVVVISGPSAPLRSRRRPTILMRTPPPRSPRMTTRVRPVAPLHVQSRKVRRVPAALLLNEPGGTVAE